MIPIQELLTNLVRALDHPDWTIPWAGIGGFLLGVGSALSGVASLMTARRKGRDEGGTSVNSESDDGGGERISGSDSSESGSSSTGANGND
jgi:hypothetical protein